jgi:hypothetical protein
MKRDGMTAGPAFPQKPNIADHRDIVVKSDLLLAVRTT